jgi:hypothetical protein
MKSLFCWLDLTGWNSRIRGGKLLKIVLQQADLDAAATHVFGL